MNSFRFLIILLNFAENIKHYDMVRYPIGIQTFEKIRKGNYLYVDKTPFVYELASNKTYVFLSRPRRFGKSLLVSTFEAYFRGKKDLFKGLAIEEMEKEWTEYPVLHFSLAMAKLGTVENLNNQINMQLEIAENTYGVKSVSKDITTRFYTLVTNLYAKTGKQVVVLIDEYDAPLLNVLHEPEMLEPMRAALQAFYSPLKDLDPYLRFVFITGISKFSQLSIFSQINNLYKISMMPEYADICGITQKELEENFKEGIQKLSEKNNWTREQVISELKKRYDGYHFAKKGAGVYNPFSLLYAMDTGELDNYWFSTGTPSFLVKMLKKFHTDVSKIDGSQADASEFDAPTENMHSILPLFYQSGYITIKDYDPILDFYTLGFPNQEVKVGMIRSLIPFYVSTDTNLARSTIAKMYMALRNDDISEALSVARSFFAGIPYEEGTLKDAPTTEGHFTAMLYLMFSFLNIYVYAQVRTAKGRMDILLKTDTTIYVMELKMDGSTDEALRQIDDKGYAIPYEHDGRRIVKVGINFSSEERTIKDWKIKE